MLDPAGGSWFVEDLTEQLAERAWEHFQQIESHSGFADAGDYIAAQIAEVRDRRTDDINHRRTALTGVNEYSNLDESPLPHRDSPATIQRYAAGFEALRDRSDAHLEKTGSRPKVLLLPLGPLAERNIRATFATNLLASGGIEAVNPGAVDSAGVADAVSGAGARMSSWSVRDRRPLRNRSGRCGGRLRARRGCRGSCWPDPEKAVAEADPKPDDYLTAKIDAVGALSDLLTRLGA